MFILAAILLVALAILLLWLSSRQRVGLGVPEGRVVYEDSGVQRRLEEPLFDEDLNLVGKPDYLIQSKQGLIPVEVKSSRTPSRPFETHIYQLAAYCALVERNFHQRPPYGIIRYPERSFTVEFTRDLERRLVRLMEEMQGSLDRGELHRSHSVAARCKTCGFSKLCPEHI